MNEKNINGKIKAGVVLGETYGCNIEIYNAGIVVVDKDNVKNNSITDVVLQYYAQLTQKQKNKITEKIIDYGRKNIFSSDTTGGN